MPCIPPEMCVCGEPLEIPRDVVRHGGRVGEALGIVALEFAEVLDGVPSGHPHGGVLNPREMPCDDERDLPLRSRFEAKRHSQAAADADAEWFFHFIGILGGCDGLKQGLGTCRAGNHGDRAAVCLAQNRERHGPEIRSLFHRPRNAVVIGEHDAVHADVAPTGVLLVGNF